MPVWQDRGWGACVRQTSCDGMTKMASVPILAGIDLSSNKRNCAIVEGEPTEGTAGVAMLRLARADDQVHGSDEEEEGMPSQGGLAWGLEPVRRYLRGLSVRCETQRRQAVVAVDVPFGYPDHFRSYLENPLREISGDAGQRASTEAGKNPVDARLYRVCELRLMDLLRYGKRAATHPATQTHRELWAYYERLRGNFPAGQKPAAATGTKTKPKASPGWNAKPLCTVGSWLAVNVIKWMRLCGDVGATVLAPSVWKLPSGVFLFECYPAATQILSGFWHPRLKAGKLDCETRRAAKALLNAGKIKLGAGNPAVDLRHWWGVVVTRKEDIISTDHRFDAFTALLTAWWLGKHLSAVYPAVGIEDYPSPRKTRIHPSSFVAAPVGLPEEGQRRTCGEGTIYYPATPDALLRSAT